MVDHRGRYSVSWSVSLRDVEVCEGNQRREEVKTTKVQKTEGQATRNVTGRRGASVDLEKRGLGKRSLSSGSLNDPSLLFLREIILPYDAPSYSFFDSLSRPTL